MKKKKQAEVSGDKITPFLWFDHRAEEAAKFYVSLFKGSQITSVSRFGEEGPGPKGGAMVFSFKLAGRDFAALNGGPHFKFTEAVSLMVRCGTQAEVDRFWEKLSQGGEEGPCGWLKDKYGLSWQIVPDRMGKWMTDKDPAKSGRVMKALLRMKKLDIAALEQAYRGK